MNYELITQEDFDSQIKKGQRLLCCDLTNIKFKNDMNRCSLFACKMPGKIFNVSFNQANLQGCNFEASHISGCNFDSANLNSCNFNFARIEKSNFFSVKTINTTFINTKTHWDNAFLLDTCPTTGSFTAFKYVSGYIVELLIPKDAYRTSDHTRRCRASKAKTISITNKDGSPSNLTYIYSTHNCRYEVGKLTKVPFFDKEGTNITGGIYFFITRQEAVSYGS